MELPQRTIRLITVFFIVACHIQWFLFYGTSPTLYFYALSSETTGFRGRETAPIVVPTIRKVHEPEMLDNSILCERSVPETWNLL